MCIRDSLISMSTTVVSKVISEIAGTAAFDLQGRMVTKPKHGIYIVNKRKVLK